MISMLKILSIKAPDPNAFSTSDIDFRVEGEHVHFDKLDFKGDAISLLGKGEMNFQGDTDMVLAATVGPADAGVPALRNFFSRSEPADHADSRHRQLAEPRHPPGGLARREPGLEKSSGEPMSIGPMTSIAGSVAGTALAQTRGSDIDRASRRAARGSFAPKANRRPSWPPASARPTATTTRPPTATPTAGDCGSFAGGKASRGRRQRRAARRSEVPDPTGQSGSMLDLSG